MKSTSPLVNRIAMVVGAIVLTALVNMASTLAVSNSIEGNATAINQTGTLRMGVFHILSFAAMNDVTGTGTDDIRRMTDNYQKLLTGPDITRAIPDSDGHPLAAQYQSVLDLWQQGIRSLLENHVPGTPLPAATLQATEDYVDSVDQLVTMLEQRTEARIDLLHLIQIISLTFSILIIIALFLDLKNRILRPLRKLVRIAMAVAEQDFSQKAHLSGGGELARLGQAFDQMTDQLDQSYSHLEGQVRDQTEELEKSHSALQLLHSASRNLFANHDICTGSVPMLQELEKLLGIGPIHLYLHDRETTEPVKVVTTATRERPFYCRDHHCNACLVIPEAYDDEDGDHPEERRLLLPIRTPGNLLGTLEVWYPAQPGLSETSRRLMETLSDQLATAIFLERQITEEQQMTLAEERTVIARELHDSLAQSLSYLKMQVARLRRLDIDSSRKQVHDDILEELSTGLNGAYRQLRELLATFRLKLDTPDLHSALNKTTAEFSERLGSPVHMTYNLPPGTLSPNEEIHTLQIIREALSNAVKHAHASEVSVEVVFESPAVCVRIRDNGVGLPNDSQPVNHYGLIIIRDRTRTLGGEVQIHNHEQGGVEVSLTFIPKSRNLMSIETLEA